MIHSSYLTLSTILDSPSSSHNYKENVKRPQPIIGHTCDSISACLHHNVRPCVRESRPCRAQPCISSVLTLLGKARCRRPDTPYASVIGGTNIPLATSPVTIDTCSDSVHSVLRKHRIHEALSWLVFLRRRRFRFDIR